MAVFKIKSGSTNGRVDTDGFIELLNRLPENSSAVLRDFFADSSDVIVARAPGRLDVMGGIADYSGSLVLQFPIANATHVAVQLQATEMLSIVSLQGSVPSVFEMPLSDFGDRGRVIEYAVARERFALEPQNRWAAYVAGAFLVLMHEKGCSFEKGARIFINSSVPVARGVSSSASLEVSAMQAITGAYAIELSQRELARFCQKVENLVAGAPCGIMDQITATCGEEDRLLELLCQPDELIGNVKLPAELRVWGIDSGISHSVGAADYGTVRTAAFMGYRIIADQAGLSCHDTGVHGRLRIDDPKWNGYLCNLTPTEFDEFYEPSLPEQISGEEFLDRYVGTSDSLTSVRPERLYPVSRATRHPIYEHSRVSRFAEILKNWQDLEQAEALGSLMYQSHESYSACGLGSPGTDEIVNSILAAGAKSGLYGARITGGGSGGTVAVLGHREARSEIELIARNYARRRGIEAVVISGSSPGASVFGRLRLARSPEYSVAIAQENTQ